VQALELQAVERLDARGGLRIRHGGRDQVVEVDVLDVEGLAHMGAAVAQDVDDLVPVGRGIEMSLHRLRPGGHLAQRQRGSENLDQNGVHRPDTVPAGRVSCACQVNQTSI